MEIRELSIPDAYEVTPRLHEDERGLFYEWYRFETLERSVGHPLELRQANVSRSKRGVVRGIHFADVPRGQAKFVTAMAGSVLDYVIDIRVGSPTFGQWDSVLLDQVAHRSVYLSEGLGHAFVALTDDAVVSYLVSDVFQADREHAINPFDLDVALKIPAKAGAPIVSSKDADAPSLAKAESDGLLPSWRDCRAYYTSLNR